MSLRNDTVASEIEKCILKNGVNPIDALNDISSKSKNYLVGAVLHTLIVNSDKNGSSANAMMVVLNDLGVIKENKNSGYNPKIYMFSEAVRTRGCRPIDNFSL